MTAADHRAWGRTVSHGRLSLPVLILAETCIPSSVVVLAEKQRNKMYTMDVDGVADTGPKGKSYLPYHHWERWPSRERRLLNLICCAGKGAELMVIDGKPTPKQHTRDPLSVKMKPKRGQSSRKQKQRLAIKLDKVWFNTLLRETQFFHAPVHAAHMSRLELALFIEALSPLLQAQQLAADI